MLEFPILKKLTKILKLKNLKNEFSVFFSLPTLVSSLISRLCCFLVNPNAFFVNSLNSNLIIFVSNIWVVFFFSWLIWKIVVWNWIIRAERFKFDMHIVFIWRSRGILNRIEKYVVEISFILNDFKVCEIWLHVEQWVYWFNLIFLFVRTENK